MTRFALFRDGKRVSKEHSTDFAARIEAVETGAVIKFGKWMHLADGYEVKEVTHAD